MGKWFKMKRYFLTWEERFYYYYYFIFLSFVTFIVECRKKLNVYIILLRRNTSLGFFGIEA